MMFERRMQRAMDALGRGDLVAIMEPWAADGVLELAGRTTLSGRYEGRAAIEGLFRRLIEGTTAIRLTVRHVAFANPVGLTRSNTIYVESEIEETGVNGVTVHDERIAVYTWRGGRLVALREWSFDPTIIEAIWGRAPKPRAHQETQPARGDAAPRSGSPSA